MNRTMLLAGFVGAAIGSPLGVMALFLVAWRAAQKVNAGTAAAAATPTPEAGLRLVDTDEQAATGTTGHADSDAE